MERLISQYGSVLDEEIIEMIFQNNDRDVAKSQQELSLLAGDTLMETPAAPAVSVAPASPPTVSSGSHGSLGQLPRLLSPSVAFPCRSASAPSLASNGAPPAATEQTPAPLARPSPLSGAVPSRLLPPAKPADPPTPPGRARAAAKLTRHQQRPTPARPELKVRPTPLQEKLSAGVPLVIIMRGLPGSGKSTLARQLTGPSGVVVSADDYFVGRDGQYRFRAADLRDAHEFCRLNARRALRKRRSPVIVDNTNTELWEMKPYAELAAQHDYYLEVVEPTTSWRWEPRVLAKRNVHGVPLASIERMLERYQGSDVASVTALYRMIDMKPKLWPPPGSKTTPNLSAQDRAESFASPTNVNPTATILPTLRSPKTVNGSVSVESVSTDTSQSKEESTPRVGLTSQEPAVSANHSETETAELIALASAAVDSSAVLGPNDVGESDASVSTALRDAELRGVDALASDLATVVLEEATQKTEKSDSPAGAAPAGGQARPSQLSRQLSAELPSLASVVSDSWAAACAADTQRLWRDSAERERACVAAAPQYSGAQTQTGGPDAGRQLAAYPRDIVAADSQRAEQTVPQQVRLHRGTMTSPPPLQSAACGVAELHALFPACSETDLLHILEQCNGDVNWATNVLLDSNQETLPSSAPAEEVSEAPGEVATEPAQLAEREDGGPVDSGRRQLVPYEDSEGSGPDVIMETYSEHSELGTRSVSESVVSTSTSSSVPAAGPASAVPLSEADLTRPPPPPALHQGRAASASQATPAVGDTTGDSSDAEPARPNPTNRGARPRTTGLTLTIGAPSASDTAPAPGSSVPGRARAAAAGAVGGEQDWSSGADSGASTPRSLPSEEEEDPVLSVVLPATLLQQLQELFGPSAFGPYTARELAEAPAKQRTAELGLGLARSLHRAWLVGSATAFADQQRVFEELRQRANACSAHETLRSDEDMARRLQREENDRGSATQASSPTPQLREIMQMEQAIQNSEQDSGSGSDSQALRLTRQRLRDEFPGMDSSYLNDLLDIHDGDYRQVLEVLHGTRGDVPIPQPALRAPAPPAERDGAELAWISGEGLPSFEDLQAESEVYRQKMQHAELMIRRAIGRNWGGVSQYYVAERDRLAGLLNECRLRAAVTSVELRHGGLPDQLDLHQLMVEEALTVLASFIAERQKEFGRKGYRKKTVNIITGRGKNSKKGKARIKPAVINWLTNKDIKFEEAPNNPGMLVVTVQSEHMYRPRQ